MTLTNFFQFQVPVSWALNTEISWLSVREKVPQSQFKGKQGAAISNVSGFTLSWCFVVENVGK